MIQSLLTVFPDVPMWKNYVHVQVGRTPSAASDDVSHLVLEYLRIPEKQEKTGEWTDGLSTFRLPTG